jgi:NAD+ dependent glucose-6-phosphate dehydrogenase
MPETATKKQVLITGAYGLIGNLLYAHLAAQPERYDVFGLVKSVEPSMRTQGLPVTEIPDERLRLADVSDFEAVARGVAGMHTVIHLAAEPDSRASWESILANNIIGAHNVFEAARQAGVKRVIFASSNQVVFGYGAEAAYRPLLSGRLDEVDLETLRRIDHTQPTRPLSDYGCSKVFGEALAHMYANSHGLSCLCLRIGWVVADDRAPIGRGQTLWCSQRDIIQLVERCVNAPDSLRFEVFFGQSDNRYNFVDIEHARQVLGYAPQDRAEERME